MPIYTIAHITPVESTCKDYGTSSALGGMRNGMCYLHGGLLMSRPLSVKGACDLNQVCDILQGLPGVSLQWGAWGGSGMATQEGPLLSRLARLGMGAIQPVQGLQTLQHVLQG